MFALLTLCYIIFEISHGKPIANCEDQMECLEVEQNSVNSTHNEVCIWFNDDLENCNKEDKISHVCTGELDEHKTEGWNAGQDYGKCQTVPCGTGDDNYAYFGVKDGGGCKVSPDGSYEFSDVAGMFCYGLDDDSEGGLCAGSGKSCTWKIPSGDCPDNCLGLDDYECMYNPDCCWFVVEGEGAECIEGAHDDDFACLSDDSDDTPEPQPPTAGTCRDYDNDATGCGLVEANCCHTGSQCNDNSDGCGCTSCDGLDDLDCGSTDGCCIYNTGQMEGEGVCQSTSNAMSISRDEDENNNQLITGSAPINNVNVVFFAVLCLFFYIY